MRTNAYALAYERAYARTYCAYVHTVRIHTLRTVCAVRTHSVRTVGTRVRMLAHAQCVYVCVNVRIYKPTHVRTHVCTLPGFFVVLTNFKTAFFSKSHRKKGNLSASQEVFSFTLFLKFLNNFAIFFKKIFLLCSKQISL